VVIYLADVVFSVFDNRVGPVPIISSVDQNIANKIALKSQLTLSMSPEGNVKESGLDAVIPFPDENKVAYVFLFMINPKGSMKGFVASLSLLVNDKKTFELYKHVNFLRQAAIELSKSIKQQLNNQTDYKLNKNIERDIKSWSDHFESAEIIYEEEIKKRKIILTDKKSHQVCSTCLI
jgi:hypothetical protein